MVKKILFLIVPAMYSGGQERVVSRLTEILQDTYELKVVIFDGSIIDYPIYCDYVSLNLPSKKDRSTFMRILFVLMRSIKLRRLVNKHRPYAALSFGVPANLVNVIASAGKSKALIMIHGYGTIQDLGGNRNYFKRFIFARAQSIICVSKVMAQDYAAIMPKVRDKLQVLYNAYDLKEIRELAGQETEMEALFAENDVVVTVGTLDPVKGYWHLIKAFSILKKKRSNVRLLHIGPDFYGYGEVLQKLIKGLGLEKEVIMLGFQDNPYKYVAKSKVFVLSSISEGFPNVLVEAMACGVPVVSTDCKSGPGEILFADDKRQPATAIELADYGILTPPLNPVENYRTDVIEPGQEILAEAIELFLADPALGADYARKAQERAGEFSYERWKQETIAIIEGEAKVEVEQ